MAQHGHGGEGGMLCGAEGMMTETTQLKGCCWSMMMMMMTTMMMEDDEEDA